MGAILILLALIFIGRRLGAVWTAIFGGAGYGGYEILQDKIKKDAKKEKDIAEEVEENIDNRAETAEELREDREDRETQAEDLEDRLNDHLKGDD